MSLKFTVVALSVVVALSIPLTSHADALLQEVTIDKGRASAAYNKSIVLKQGTRTWTVPVSEVRLWFKTRSLDGATLLQLKPGAIYNYLNVHVSPLVNDLGEQSRFSSSNGVITQLHGGRKGKIVDGVKTSLAVRSALVNGAGTVTVAMKEQRPTVFSVSDFKKLSFPTLLGRGESNFAGSPRNRIHNIQVATKRFNGIVLLPGEEFSFNSYLGDVDASNGYLPELVIKENVTTPEFGGGICQVSTTAFRGAMQSGLDVTARRNHSYPVAYYGTPGYDATVYSPAPNLRFKNDYPAPVLIKTSVVGTKVIFEVWGKNDGRTTKVNGPFVTQRKPDGSLTAAVAQIVTKGGKNIREENFVSKYQSPDKFPTVRKTNGEN